MSTHTLNRGYTQPCGCYRKEKAKQDNTIHGMTGTKIHNKWLSLIDRENVCDEWKYNFMNFYDWSMSHGYKNDLFLCRVDLDKGFNPDNCKWMTKKEYVRKNQSKLYTYKGKTKVYVYICLNEKEVTEDHINSEESAEPVTMYEYDYNEIIEDIGVLDIDDVKTNPEKYLNYKKAVEKTDKERIAELEAMNAELSTTVDSILTDVLPTLMGA